MKDEETLCNQLKIPLRVLREVASTAKSYYYYQRRPIGKKVRLLRIPQGRLCEIQRAIKTKLLDPMPLSQNVHGWRKRHSPKTYVKSHLRQAIIVNADIKDFFPSVSAGRVYGFWIEKGYSPDAANLLTSLTTCDNQLPQGSATSQSIGNQVLRKLNRRLEGLAVKHRLNQGSYGDEVSISGRGRVVRLKGLLCKIIEQEGFKTNPGKLKVMPRYGRQEITGLVVNKKSSPGRGAYRELRAIIHNCVKYGPETQNRGPHPNFKAHLRGRVAQFQYLNPRIGNQLLSELEKIHWPET